MPEDTDFIEKKALNQAIGGDVSHETFEKIKQYQILTEKWQKSINLIGRGTISDIWNRHFVDSAQLLPLLPEGGGTLIDIGSGGGFPGLVLAMLAPDWDIHLVESDSRKCSFLRTVSRETNTPVTVHEKRVEDVLEDEFLTPDIVTARALAPLDHLLTLTRPWVIRHPELLFLFPKGRQADDEIAAAQKKVLFTCEQHHSLISSESRILAIRHPVYKSA